MVDRPSTNWRALDVMLKARAVAICLFAFLPTQALAGSLVGYWYGRGYQPVIREVTQFIGHYREDGGFEIHFRVYRDCVATFDQSEAGSWAMLSADTYRIVRDARFRR